MAARALTVLEYALLGLLAEEARTGYAVRRVFETTPIAHYGGSPGSIYPALRRLERRRLVSGRAAPTRRGRGARVLAATAAGRRTLLAWLARPVTREDAVWREDELLLRFAFVRRAGPERTAAFLAEYRAAMRTVGEELRSFLEGPGATYDLTGRLALRHGVAAYAANERWAAEALRTLRAEGRAHGRDDR